MTSRSIKEKDDVAEQDRLLAYYFFEMGSEIGKGMVLQKLRVFLDRFNISQNFVFIANVIIRM